MKYITLSHDARALITSIHEEYIAYSYYKEHAVSFTMNGICTYPEYKDYQFISSVISPNNILKIPLKCEEMFKQDNLSSELFTSRENPTMKDHIDHYKLFPGRSSENKELCSFSIKAQDLSDTNLAEMKFMVSAIPSFFFNQAVIHFAPILATNVII
ncbi:hypothetical protein BDB01DRAFT_868846 [Pilobolus umbonatus]|nr:hypothetical protein BDB01DRAFT_868846 [Pilobolus umbonatus]